jgi:hypothetical protein
MNFSRLDYKKKQQIVLLGDLLTCLLGEWGALVSFYILMNQSNPETNEEGE